MPPSLNPDDGKTGHEYQEYRERPDSSQAVPSNNDVVTNSPGVPIDELLDRAVSAINRGDRAVATALAEQVFAVDDGNADAEDLLAAPTDGGEIRRLTILFADLVDSTVLSTRVEPETYRLLVGRYRDQVLQVADRYDGHVGSTKGDGSAGGVRLPQRPRERCRRAVQAGLEITRDVARLSEQAKRRFGTEIKSVWGCTADWCIWTPPRTTSTGWPPIWPRGCRVWRRRVRWWSPTRSSR